MAHFPVTNSNLSAAHLAVFLKDKYALGEDATCKLIRAGVNHSYLVTDCSERFVFRVYSLGWRSETDILEELRLLALLKRAGIPVSYPIADNGNKYIQALNAPEGERFAVLFSYAPGEKLHNYSEDTHFQIGRLMAGFHSCTLNLSMDRDTYSPEVLLVRSMEQLADYLPADAEEMGMMRSMQVVLMDTLLTADVKNIRKGIVHLDMWFDNMNVTSDNLATVFDFDFCGNGWLCLDIAYYIMQLHTTELDPTQYQLKKEAFLRGYESVLGISSEERRLLPALGVCLYFFYLWVQCQRFDNFSSVFISETYLKRYVTHRVKRYFDFNELRCV